jgi:hypothetical protein
MSIDIYIDVHGFGPKAIVYVRYDSHQIIFGHPEV